MILAVVGLRCSEQVLSSCSTQALWLPHGMWDLSIPVCSALKGGFLTTGSLGRSLFLHLDSPAFYDRFLLGRPLEQTSAVICSISFTNSNTVSSPAVFRALQRTLPNSVNWIFRWSANWVLNSFCLIECLRPICFKIHLEIRLCLHDGIKKDQGRASLTAAISHIVPKCLLALPCSSTERSNRDSRFWL